MLFNSFEFLVFFIVVTATYFLIEHRYRWILLLISSCYFYMALMPVYILVLFAIIIIDYFTALEIEKREGKQKKQMLIISIMANLGVLILFKYYNFINLNLDLFFGLFGTTSPIPYLSVILPIGLSFHTFQAMSYTLEVYKGRQKAEKHFGIYALFVMFYPQLVAGPIERPQNLLHQFYEKHSFEYDRFVSGIRLIAFGLFKKVVIADRLSIVVDNVYNNPSEFNALSLIIASFFFAFQIYCDFSGYSDMALGIARVMGFNLMKNFDNPYQSSTVSEFWKRWHISLSSWFKEYLYFSLGGNRVSVNRMYLNLMLVFLISGLWHGANWTFIVWGGLNGLYLVSSIIFNNTKNKFGLNKLEVKSKMLKVLSTFILINISWVFFRAKDVETGIFILNRIFNGIIGLGAYQTEFKLESMGLSNSNLLLCFGLIFGLELFSYFTSKTNFPQLLDKQHTIIRWCIYYIIIFTILFFGIFENREFIYFQF